jgi:hypothetical protein
MNTAADRPSPIAATDRLDRLLDTVSGERLAGMVGVLAGAPFTGRRVGTGGGGAAATASDRAAAFDTRQRLWS